jgi:hypothetical protein
MKTLIVHIPYSATQIPITDGFILSPEILENKKSEDYDETKKIVQEDIEFIKTEL